MSRRTSAKMTAAIDQLSYLAHRHCRVCGKKIKVMCFKGTGICSEICRKRRDREEIGALESRTAG